MMEMSLLYSQADFLAVLHVPVFCRKHNRLSTSAKMCNRDSDATTGIIPRHKYKKTSIATSHA